MLNNYFKKLYICIMFFLAIVFSCICVLNISIYKKNEAIEIEDDLKRMAEETGKTVAIVKKVNENARSIVGMLEIQEYEKKEKKYILLQIGTSVMEFVLVGIILWLILKKLTKPMEESYSKQRRFLTDASHDLKTPLTLMKTNLEILGMEIGPNEWIEDMNLEVNHMTNLVTDIVEMNKMAELNDGKKKRENVSMELSECVLDVVSEYEEATALKGYHLEQEIEKGIISKNDEGNIRRVLTILLDNALKYCDSNGEIVVSLKDAKKIELTVINSCQSVDTIDLNKLFDRFYREDTARTAGEGFGIGLAIAKSVCENENAKITAYKAAENAIGFKVFIKK